MKNANPRSIRLPAGIALLGLSLSCAAQPAAQNVSQPYPAKPILLVMPLQAGSAVDGMIRLVAQKMSDHLGRPLVVENQPGAGCLIGAQRGKRGAPDGHTLGGLDGRRPTTRPNIR